MRNVVFMGMGLPDSWTDVVNLLPAGVTPRISQNIENLLDREEIRRVDVVAHGVSALPATLFAAKQPHRVDRLVLVDPVLNLDTRAYRYMPGFFFRGKKQEIVDALADASAQLGNITASVTVLGQSRAARRAAETLGVSAQPGGADYRHDPVGFVEEIRGPLGL